MDFQNCRLKPHLVIKMEDLPSIWQLKVCCSSYNNITERYFLRIIFCIAVTFQNENDLQKDEVDLLSSHSFTTDMKELREFVDACSFADITLICRGHRYPAHKLLLAARSDVFYRMFQHDNTKEAETKQVELKDTDTDPATVSRFLR